MLPIKIQPSDSVFHETIFQYVNLINEKRNLLGIESKIRTFENDVNGIPVIHYHDLEAIRNCPNDIILINLIQEGYHVVPNFTGLNPKKLYLLFTTGNWDTRNVKFDFNYRILQFTYTFTLIYWFFFKPSISLSFWFDKTKKTVSSTKFNTFFCLGGSKKIWRSKAINRLLNSDLSTDKVIIYDRKLVTNNDTTYLDLYAKKAKDSYSSFVPDYNFNLSFTIPEKLINDFSYQLIFETNSYEFEEFLPTEKTIKAVLSGMPFLVFSSPYFLKNFRKLGFKTYDSLWSEDYDNILNFEERLDAIIKVAKELENFDWKSKQHELTEIAYYNLFRLFNMHDLFEAETVKIVNEIETVLGLSLSK